MVGEGRGWGVREAGLSFFLCSVRCSPCPPTPAMRRPRLATIAVCVAAPVAVAAAVAARPRGGASTLARLAPLQRGPLGAARSSSRLQAVGPASVGLTGRWRKDRARSDDMTLACDAVALPFLLRRAIAVLSVLDVVDDSKDDSTGGSFETTIKAGGVLDVREKYPWTGAPVTHARRDKRRGGHTGRVARSSAGNPVIEVTWGDPHGGFCADEFLLGNGGRTLTQRTVMDMATGARVEYDTVYVRER